jgi:hypothetical protein
MVLTPWPPLPLGEGELTWEPLHLDLARAFPLSTLVERGPGGEDLR